MINKRSILGVVVTLSLLASFVVAAVPASAGTLSWTTFTPPSTSNKVLTTSDITDIAVAGDGKTVFAVTASDNIVFKSADKGVTWSEIMTSASTNTDNADLIAVAPDDANYIVVADPADFTVTVTTNGGTNWYNLTTTAISGLTAINDLAFSAALSGVHYVAVVGTSSVTGAGVWYFNVGAAAPVWTAIATSTGFTSGNTSAAVAFSPAFASDQVMAAVTANVTSGIVSLQLFSFNSKVWNGDAGFSGYPGTVLTTTGLTNTGIIAASIALDPGYLGSDDSTRLAFIGLTLDPVTNANSGIWRMSDTTAKDLKIGAAVQMKSVAWNGSVLVAGRYDSNIVYYSSDATASSPTVSTTTSYKRPGLDSATASTVVAWAGADVVASTKGAGCAFSVSRNNAKSFNDISLINTTLTNMRDVGVSADGTKVYLVSDNGTNLSVWRKTTAWERVFTIAATDYLIRLAPDNSDVVYIAARSGTAMYYSADSGETRWQIRTVSLTVQDVAVEGAGDVVYAMSASDGKVAKSTNSGFTWASAKSTGLSSGNMITSLSKDNLLVGSANGYVAFSTDGNSTWTYLSSQIDGGSGAVQAVASGLATGAYIYATNGIAASYIYRWQLGQASTSWTKIYTTAFGSAQYGTGMALVGNTLYAVSSNGTAGSSALYRTTNATLSPTVYWSTVTGTQGWGIAPKALFTSAGTLWAIDKSTTNTLKSFTDTLVKVTFTLNGPKQDLVVGINPISGNTYDVTFNWNRPSDDVTGYRLQIANDQGFDEIAKQIDISETGSPIAAVVGRSATYTFDFNPGATYFWRVRVQTPITSNYSEVRRVTVTQATTQPPIQVTVPPAQPAPQITLTVPPPTTITIPPPPPAPAPIVPGFVWGIIIIGAILVIALIVLIVRTRRVP